MCWAPRGGSCLAADVGAVLMATASAQGRMLWIFDPKAIHQIAVKDMDIFEEAKSFSL